MYKISRTTLSYIVRISSYRDNTNVLALHVFIEQQLPVIFQYTSENIRV